MLDLRDPSSTLDRGCDRAVRAEPDRLGKLLEVDRLGEMEGETRRAALFDVGRGPETGKRDRRDRPLGAQGPEQLEPGAIRELDIADDHVDMAHRRELKGRRHAGGREDVVAPQREQP